MQQLLQLLRLLRELGVRYMTLTHNSNVDWADSATDVERIGDCDAQSKYLVSAE